MKQREKILLSLAGVVGVIVGIYYVIWPKWNQYHEWQSTIDDNVEQMRTAQQTAAKIDQLVEDMTETKRKLKRSRQKLPKESKFNELMSRIEQEARKAGIPDGQIVSINRGSTNEREMIKELTIRAQFEQISMEQLAQMLWRFDNMIEMVDIKSFDNVNLTRVNTEEGYRYNLSLQIVVYIMKNSVKIESEQA